MLNKATFSNVYFYIILILVVILRISFINSATGPLVSFDEVSYSENARIISGLSSVSAGYKYYPIGYSLLFSPFLRLSNDPLVQYKIILVFNFAVFIAGAFGLYYFINKLTNKFSIKKYVLLLCLLYPSLIIYNGFALSENVFVWFQLLHLYVFYKILSNKFSTSTLVLWSFLGFYLFLIRENGLFNYIFGFIYIVINFFKKKVSLINFLLYISTFIFLYVFFKQINIKLFENDVAGRGGILLNSSNIKIVFSWDYIKRFLETICGHLFYLVFSTLGLPIYSILVCLFKRNILLNWINKSVKNKKILLLFAWVTALVYLNLVFSSFFMAINPTRGDHYIYGRYVEGLILVYLLVTIVFLYKFLSKKKLDFGVAVLVYLAAVVFCLIVLKISLFTNWTDMFISPFHTTSTFTLFNLVYDWQKYLGIWYLLLLSIPFWLLYWNYKMGVVFICLVFLLRSTIFLNSFYKIESQRKVYDRQVSDYVRKNYLKTVDSICYDFEKYSFWGISQYRYFLPEQNFIRINSEYLPNKDCSLIISSKENEILQDMDYKLLVIENWHNQALWGKSDFVQNEIDLSEIDYRVSYEKSGYRSKLNLISGKNVNFDTENDYGFKFFLENSGDKVWFNAASVGSYGSVKLAVEWFNEENVMVAHDRCELPKILFPREGIYFYCGFKKPSDDVLYATFRLVHEGVSWFDEYGQENIVYDLSNRQKSPIEDFSIYLVSLLEDKIRSSRLF